MTIEKIRELAAACDEYKSLETLLKEVEAAVKAKKEEITQLMGEEELIFAGDHKVTLKSAVRESVDSKALKAAKPEVFAEFVKSTSYVTLRVS